MELMPALRDHRRIYRDFIYAYPVISRRSRGVSLGLNLNPDKVCNFDCIYCEVDRTSPPRRRDVDLGVMAAELDTLIDLWRGGALFADEPFASAPPEWRRLNDIAFSGDGEPTTYPRFDEAVEVAWRARERLGDPSVKLVLITDAACLDRPVVRRGVLRMAQGAHEIWAKLDAGTEAYYRIVNRTRIPLARVLANITRTAAEVPVWIQTLFLRVNGAPPSDAEVDAYLGRLAEIQRGGGKLLGIQLYTVARPTPESWATALSDAELDTLAARVARESGLPVETFHGNGTSRADGGAEPATPSQPTPPFA
jgi:wyosine [tRNA(Phe)-imidazoG37] synthetase (radical SAM superfamily)